MNKLLLALSALSILMAAAQPSFAQELKGNAVDGEKKIIQCIGCHGIAGYQASFPEVYRVPMISGQNAKYIVGALTVYRKGDRKHPTMRGVVDNLSEQDMADVAAYFSGQGIADNGKVAAGPALAPATDGTAAAVDLVTKGGCKACHGENFSKPIDPGYPKIAGQHADYLLVALKSYKIEGSAVMGRNNPIMGAMAKQFSNAELKVLANYVASLPGELKTVAQSKFK
jgi:cytochrome c553